MKGFYAARAGSLSVASLVAVSSFLLLAAGPGVPTESGMDFWEAYGRGLVSVTIEDRTFQRGENTVTLPVGLRVGNTADVPVVLSEEAVLMSPFFAESPAEPGSTTQDAVLTTETIPAGGSILFSYGEDVLQGYVPGPAWWCSEEFQFTHAGVSYRVGGETLPFALRPLLANAHYEGPESNTQSDLWWYLRAHPAIVVGKDPLWAAIDGAPGQRVPIQVRATNLAIFTYDDGYETDVNVTGGVLEDVVPAGWTVEEGSYSDAPDEIVAREDGSQVLRWRVDLPSALDGEEEDPRLPTEYATVAKSYVLVSPALEAGTHTLPRGTSDMDGDGTPDAHSAPVRIQASVTAVVADAGGPYEAVEGDTVRLDASGTTGAAGALLRYRWDFAGDGSFDTEWSEVPEARARFTDDFDGFAMVQATDGRTTSSDLARVLVGNLDPEILDLRASSAAEFRVEIAGERWHDVRLTIASGGEVLADIGVVREPGSPEDQGASTGPLAIDLAREVSATIAYTPDDDPANGGRNGDNPAWLVLRFPDGAEVRLSHNFNVRRASTWTWTLQDLGVPLASHGIVLEARLLDRGSDDLRVTWDFGDGAPALDVFYNDGMHPDEPMSQGGIAPFEVVAIRSRPLENLHGQRIDVHVTDDDGGSAEWTLTFAAP